MSSRVESSPSEAEIAGRLICTLPRALIELLKAHFNDDSIPSESWTQECEWADKAEGPQSVALWRDSVIHYPYFKWLEIRFAEPLGGVDAIEKPAIMQGNFYAAEAIRRAADYWLNAKGYAGWLLTNPNFLTEHDQLIENHRAEIAVEGFPFLTRERFDLPTSTACEPNSQPEDCLDVWDRFYLRWRIVGFAAPYLPLPLEPQFPVLAKTRAAAMADSVGCLFYTPDTFPVPSAEELRTILEDGLRRVPRAEHLAEWMTLINCHNMAKTGIRKFARYFDVQHFARIIHQRFPSVLQRRRKGLDQALASYLNNSEATIRGDFAELKARLGNDWMSRRCGLEFVR